MYANSMVSRVMAIRSTSRWLMKTLKKYLVYTHRYLGMAFCVLFALWFVSGIVMVYKRMPCLSAMEHWPQQESVRKEILKQWRDPYGDRRQELVFIGMEMDKEQLLDELNKCLLTDGEMKLGPIQWVGLRDPFPRPQKSASAPQ